MKNKTNMIKGFEPTLTYHALVRISERIAPKTKKQANVIIGNCCVSGEFEFGWLSPDLIRMVLDDAKRSINGRVYYSPEKGLVTEGKLGWYVFGPDGNIVTVMTTLEKEYKDGMTNSVTYKFRAMYLGLEHDKTDFKYWREREAKSKLLYYK